MNMVVGSKSWRIVDDTGKDKLDVESSIMMTMSSSSFFD